jgi:hypothetical protein
VEFITGKTIFKSRFKHLVHYSFTLKSRVQRVAYLCPVMRLLNIPETESSYQLILSVFGNSPSCRFVAFSRLCRNLMWFRVSSIDWSGARSIYFSTTLSERIKNISGASLSFILRSTTRFVFITGKGLNLSCSKAYFKSYNKSSFWYC